MTWNTLYVSIGRVSRRARRITLGSAWVTLGPSNQTGAIMRAWAVVIAVVSMLVGMALPALADPPVKSTFTVTFEASNPCIEGTDVFTSTFTVYDHFGHRNNYVSPAPITGTTAAGFVLEHGTSIIVENPANRIVTFNEVFTHPDGSRFVAHGTTVLDLDSGQTRVDFYAERCVIDGG